MWVILFIWNLLLKKYTFEYFIVTGLLLGFFVCILMQWIDIWALYKTFLTMHRTNKYAGFFQSVHEY